MKNNKIFYILIIFLVYFSFLSSLKASEILGEISTDPHKQVGSVKALMKNKKTFKKIKVLGIEKYGDGTLVRGNNHKIYVINGNFKDYISSFKKLRRFKGEVIHKVNLEELKKYQTRNYLEGDLIRLKGKTKIFLIQKNKLKHILNLKELALNFRGEEIFNLSLGEMELYK